MRVYFRFMVLWLLLTGSEALAEDSVPPRPESSATGAAEATRLPEVVVPGAWQAGGGGRLSLDKPTPTGSRLGIAPRELPASVEVIDRETMETRGHRTIMEAVESATGVTVGNSPGNPANFSIRGFTNNQVSILYDGNGVGPASMTSRPLDTWNLESVDVLKGPASVLYGEGAVGGAINLITKRPRREEQRNAEAMFSFGSFNTTRFGVGSGGPIGERLHYRFDFSRQTSDGFINDTPFEYWNWTSGLLFDASERLSFEVSFDAIHDDLEPYWGTPLVPKSFATKELFGVVATRDGRTIDRRMSRVNYNVTDARMWADNYWTRVKTHWQATDQLSLKNEWYYYDAHRRWRNAETYAFNPTTLLVDRDRFFVAHDQRIFGNRSELHLHTALFGQRNRFLVGLDFSRLDFDRPSAFCCDEPDAVDPFRPHRGQFGLLTPAEQQTTIDTKAIFFEDALTIAERLTLVAGVRREWIDLDRKLFTAAGDLNSGPSFVRIFEPTTWRVGAIFEVLPELSVYGQYATAADPVGTNIFLVRENQNFALTTGRQWEVGVKHSFWQNRADWTLAYFDIEREDVLTQTSLTTVANVGQQSSRGVELATTIRPLRGWRMQGNVTYVDAEFDDFAESVGDRLLSRRGNLPPNVPHVVFNLWTAYRFPAYLPIEIGAAVRYVGDRYTDNGNTITLLDYTTVDAFLSWRLEDTASFKNSQFSVRARNLLNEDYAAWGDPFYASQILRSEPRSIEFSVSTRFEGF